MAMAMVDSDASAADLSLIHWPLSRALPEEEEATAGWSEMLVPLPPLKPFKFRWLL